MTRALIVGVVSLALAAAFAVPAHAEPDRCASVTTYEVVTMPPPWTPASLCAFKEALVDRTPLPEGDWTG